MRDTRKLDTMHAERIVNDCMGLYRTRLKRLDCFRRLLENLARYDRTPQWVRRDAIAYFNGRADEYDSANTIFVYDFPSLEIYSVTTKEADKEHNLSPRQICELGTNGRFVHNTDKREDC